MIQEPSRIIQVLVGCLGFVASTGFVDARNHDNGTKTKTELTNSETPKEKTRVQALLEQVNEGFEIGGVYGLAQVQRSLEQIRLLSEIHKIAIDPTIIENIEKRLGALADEPEVNDAPNVKSLEGRSIIEKYNSIGRELGFPTFIDKKSNFHPDKKNHSMDKHTKTSHTHGQAAPGNRKNKKR